MSILFYLTAAGVSAVWRQGEPQRKNEKIWVRFFHAVLYKT